tara:strand:- start:44 stop:319 length:276 start_codon:yes stop_codon:yes gene_type:complete
MNRSDILAQADDIINNDRAAAHGDAHKTFAMIADRWTNLLNIPVSPEEVALMMIDLKIVRTLQSPRRADNWVDIIGYAALGAEIAGAKDDK